jgi:putative endonuclease
MFTVYCLYSKRFEKIYIGYTSDLISRFRSHNELSSKGWTLNYRPWVVVYTEVYEGKKEAMTREKSLKSQKGREFLWKHIKENNY